MPETFQDYGPNGLQIEGSETIKHIAFAVSATKDSVQRTIEIGADTLIVHHGLFWKFHGPKTLTGPFAKRVIPLVKNDINLFGFHLPLDGHQEVGNAVSVAHLIGLEDLQPFGEYKGAMTGTKGHFKNPIKADELSLLLEKKLNHKVILSSPNPEDKISTLGIITGGANSDWIKAQQEGLDAYLTGEISEHDWNEAKEAGIHMFAGGHHATEKFGIQSLMQKLQKQYPNLKSSYISSENPA